MPTTRCCRPCDEASSRIRVLIGYTLEHHEPYFGVLRLHSIGTTGYAARESRAPSSAGARSEYFNPPPSPTNPLPLDGQHRSAVEMPKSKVYGNQYDLESSLFTPYDDQGRGSRSSMCDRYDDSGRPPTGGECKSAIGQIPGGFGPTRALLPFSPWDTFWSDLDTVRTRIGDNMNAPGIARTLKASIHTSMRY